MTKQTRLFPDRFRILSGSMLKLIAVIAMLTDHIACHLVPKSIILISIGGHSLSLYSAMRGVGRIAFPIFAFLLIEGFLHTSNKLRYGLSLFFCALLSEIPWDLVHCGHLLYSGQNVFFTLLLAYLALCAAKPLAGKPVLPFLVYIGFAVVSLGLWADYGLKGYVFILLLYALRENEVFRPLTAFFLSNHWMALTAFIPMSLYNGKRGFIRGVWLKYIFYLFYPVHLFILYLIKYRVFF